MTGRISEADVAFQHLVEGLEHEPRTVAAAVAHSRLDYAVEVVLRAADSAYVAIRRVVEQDVLYLVRWPLLTSEGDANRTNEPRHHLEAFMRGGPFSAAVNAAVRPAPGLLIVDGAAYFEP